MNGTFVRFIALLAGLLAGLTGLAASALAAEEPDIYFVPDVVGQFDALPERGDALGFGIGSSPDPEMCKHYQGIVRSHGPGTPYFFVSRSGIKTGAPGCSSGDDPGNLLIVRMGSRDATGERLRSNRLAHGQDIDDTPPDPADTTVTFLTFDGTGPWPNYGHVGGMDLVGDVLVVPLEGPYNAGAPEGLILFLDVSNPESPVLLSQIEVDDPRFTPGVVSVTPRADGRYLMLVTGSDNKVILVYESLITEVDGSTDLKFFGLSWALLDEWTKDADEAGLGGGHTWPAKPANFGCLATATCDHPHQTLHFVREGSIYGNLYLFGGRNPGGGGGGIGQDEDKFDLYRVEWEGDQFKLRWLRTKEIAAKSTSDGEDLANFAAATGRYVSPTGELIVYAAEHDNDGPGATVKAGEWRHRDKVRPGSPTLDPTADAGGPYEVPEGGSTTVFGQAAGPITRAWVELYADPDFTDRSLVIDYDDRSKDDYDDFKKTEGFSDEASSWRWFAPAGCTLRLNDDDFSDSNFPGQHTRTLSGNGMVQVADDLKNVSNDAADDDMDDELTSMQFFSDCADYYAAPLWLRWDLDGDLVYETLGAAPVFSAAGLDGPDLMILGLEARHPIDNRTGVHAALMTITNVPPQVGPLVARDSLGQILGVDVPAAVIGLPVETSGTFTDPGIPDRQTAVFDWGDGMSDPSADFDLFSDAVGGAVGMATHAHAFLQPGTFDIALRVTDDDGGQGETLLPVDILDFEEAVDLVAAGLQAILMQPGLDEGGRKALELALEKLLGDNGARTLLEADDFGTALVRIAYALLKLEDAEGTVDPGFAQDLLMQVAKAIVVVSIAEAQAVATTAADLAKIAAAGAKAAEADVFITFGDYSAAASTLHAAWVLLPKP